MRKLSIISIFLFIFSCALVIGTSSTSHSSSGFTVYEDWDILNDYNHTLWSNIGGHGWGFNGTYAAFAGNGTGASALILTDPNFWFRFNDTWDINYVVALPSCAGGNYGEGYPSIQNQTVSFANYDATQEWSFIYLSNYGAACPATISSYLDHSAAAGAEKASPTVSVTGLTAIPMNISMKKRNLANGSYYVELYQNGNLTQNASEGTYGYNSFTSNRFYLAIGSYTGANHKVSYDSINFTVYYSNYSGNTAPIVTINSPANNTISKYQPTVNFTVTDDISATTSCVLYIDGSSNLTNASVTNNSMSYFSPNFGIGAHQYNIGCDDGSLTGTSATNTFTYDRWVNVTNIAPDDHSIAGSQKNISFSAVDNKITPFSCTVTVDGTANQTNAAVVNNTATTFPMIWTQGTHNWNISCNDGEATGYGETWTFTYNSSHSILLWSPANETRTNSADAIQYEVYDSDNSTTSCSLYIDSIINATNTTVINDTISYFYPVWSQGIHSWYISCNDGVTTATSETRSFDYDTSSPFITSVTPSVFNSTTFSGYTMNIKGNVTDNNLWRVNLTLYYPNGSVLQNNYSGNLPALTTSYSWNENFNTTLMPNGIYTMFIDAADSHTAQYFPDAIAIAQTKDTLVYELPLDTVQVERIAGTNEPVAATTEKFDDRYTFDFKYEFPFAEGDTETFRVTSEQPIIYLPDSPYKAHFILANKYWLDFENYNGDATITKIDDYNYDVILTITTAKEVIAEPIQFDKGGKLVEQETEITETPLTTLSFMSLGGLNEANKSISFQVTNCVPNWQCSGYGSCNISDVAPCNATTDLNSCGTAYTGDYSEFSAQACNYCSRNIVVLNATDCISKQSTHCYNDTNWASCCNITGIGSDCIGDVFQIHSQVCVNETCSMFAYSENDITGAFIDTTAKFAITFGILAGIIVFVFVGLWAWNKVKKK